jgi:hypothetical protein
MKRFVALEVGVWSMVLVSCGGGTYTAPAPAVSVSIASGLTQTHIAPGQAIQFTATVQNTGNSAVTWQVNSIPAGNTVVGTISSTGLYTSPTSVPNPNTVTITAVSVADKTKSASVMLTIVSPVTVSVSPPSASVQINGSSQNTQQFFATVKNATNLAVTWEVNGIAGGSAALGSISPDGVYSVPTAVPNPNPITLTAVSVADPTISGSATVTINPAVVVSVLPIAPVVSFGGTQQFSASVQNTSNMGVTWSIHDVNQGGPAAIGTISSSGLYTAPASGPSSSRITISATSVVDSSQSASTPIILSAGPGVDAAELNGVYAFSVKGVLSDQSFHRPKTIIGSLIADGAGRLTGTGDKIDFNARPAPTPLHFTVSGSYSVGSNGRGSLFLAVNTATGVEVTEFGLTLGTIVAGVATEARLVELDSAFPSSAAGFTDVATGTLQKQDATAFSTSAINGDFSFGFSADSAVVFTLVGRFHADGAGNLTAGSLDTNELNGSAPLLLANAPFTGSYTVDATGRGTAVLMIPSAGTVSTVFYVVSSSELVFLGGAIPDNGWQPGFMLYNGVFSGPSLKQTGAPFSNISLSGSSVIRLTGLNTVSGSEFVAGLIVADGAGNLTGVLDQNIAGSVSLNNAITGTYAVAANGRGTLAVAGGESLVLYMISPDNAFLLRSGPGDPQIGLLEAQTLGPFSDASLSGSFTVGTLTDIEPYDPTREGAAEAGKITLDGAGNATGTVDISAFNSLGPQGFMEQDAPFQATYSVSTNGRGTMAVTSLEGGSYVLYVISPTSFFTTYIGSTSISNGFQPGLLFTQ